MVGIRKVLAAGAAILVLGSTSASALAAPPPWAHGRMHFVSPQSSLIAISGTIVGVDYATASILVATSRGVVPVAVTPSTSIYRGSAFASFADIARGAHVQIDAAPVQGRLIAQFIRIR